MTLQDALAIYLYVWMKDGSVDDCDERVVEAAVKLIEQEALRAMARSQSDRPR